MLFAASEQNIADQSAAPSFPGFVGHGHLLAVVATEIVSDRS